MTGDEFLASVKRLLGLDAPVQEDSERGEADFAEAYLPLPTSTGGPNRIKVKVIQPGWGASGYYSEEVLRRDARIFEGAKMYWNHPTKTEMKERGVRDLRDLAGTIVSSPQYDPNGPNGPGVYAEADVFPGFREAVKAIAPHIGVSIRAGGVWRKGAAEGREGRMIEQLTHAHSVDFVTEPGAGGRIVSLFESARGEHTEPQTDPSSDPSSAEPQEQGMDEQTTAALASLTESIATLQGAVAALAGRLDNQDATRARTAVVESALATLRLARPIQARITAGLVAGSVPIENLAEAAQQAARDEIAYITALAGSPVRGLGALTESGQAQTTTIQEAEAAVLEAFKALGLSDSRAALAANGLPVLD